MKSIFDDQKELNYQRELLKTEFECSADWRRKKAEQYPNDDRNSKAAEILDKLAADVGNVDAATLAAYVALFEDYPDGEAHSEMLRTIGFDWEPESAIEFVRRFIADRAVERG
ncbi:MAG: hypothetical protein FJ143_11225 [Deltaproteobacteria bacterium]|nr:hypothetical protein [Deltaproteobacteria bacterium]